ncbi:response regulator [Desulfolutivibrio sulfoxidireducens]|nr:response regulator [Desulfolutivibrio sulfoxidireducens]
MFEGRGVFKPEGDCMTPHHPRGDEPPPSTELDALRRENAELRVRLRESQERARRPIDEAKSEFLANISHELRTPLNGILGMLQIMSTTELSGEQRDCVETALDSSRTLLWVLNDILEFTRVSCEGMTLVHKPFDPRAVADSVIQAFRHRATLKGLSLTLAVHDAVSKVLVGDGGRVRQILFHLVGNAVKFTSQGQVRLEISALPPGRDPRQKAILFQVSDSGIGIPDDRLERIFVPFSQADGSASRRHQGLGLGLSVVRRIVECMDGSAAVESTAGQGTTFYLSLPFGRLPPVDAAITGNDAESAGRARAFAREAMPLRVLVVEDNTINRLVGLRILRKLGHDAMGAPRGAGVLDLLRGSRFDAVFMDIRMPEMDGVETTHGIRHDRSGKFDPNLPVVAVTAHAMPGDRETLLAQGFTDYVSKPFEISDFAEVLDRLFPRGSPTAT